MCVVGLLGLLWAREYVVVIVFLDGDNREAFLNNRRFLVLQGILLTSIIYLLSLAPGLQDCQRGSAKGSVLPI